MLIKFAPASVASALARRVFPVPGGPKSNIPLQGWLKHHTVIKWRSKDQALFSINQKGKKSIHTRNKFPWEKSSGLFMGRITSSCNAFFTSSRAPMSSNLTPISPGGTTAETKLLSYSSLARLYHKYTHKLFICSLKHWIYITTTRKRERERCL